MSDLPGTGAGTTSSETPAPAPPAAPPSPGRSSPLAVTLTTIIGALAVAAVIIAVILTHRQHHIAGPAHPLRGTIFQLRSGQCMNFGPNGTAVAHVIPCAQPHDAQVYGTVKVPGSLWPGTAALSQDARQGCQSRLNGYLNQQLPPTSVTEVYVYPNRGAWSVGGRSVICEFRGVQGKLTGPVRASGG
jgi:putative regulator of septum formation